MAVEAERDAILLAEPARVESLDDYRSRGGGEAFRSALDGDPAEIIDTIRGAGLRGRGGAGFPTARKWQGVRSSPATTKYACCNAAEGEPGTFKDRWLLRHNPYQTLEGLAIAAHIVGAKQAFFCMKRTFEPERRRVEQALEEMRADTGFGEVMGRVELVLGPDEYLYGEEKAMLEVIEGGLPLPRVFPPYLHGLYAASYAGPSDQENNPTLVNNVETLAHVPHIIRNGADWFRALGTDDTPGTMVFTVSGDVQRPMVRELPLGLTVHELIEAAGGVAEGRKVKAVFPGVANAVITERVLDTPLGFDSMRQAASALGSAGFLVYDDARCMVQTAFNLSHFLWIESCNQCAPCKLGSEQITRRLERLLEGKADEDDVEELGDIATWVTNGQRCYLATSEQLVASSVLAAFPDDFQAHLRGDCRLRHELSVPKMTDYVPGEGFTYDEMYLRKQPDWTYAGG